MSRIARTLTLLIFLILSFGFRLYGQSGLFDRAGIIPGHGSYSSLPQESVDLFTGNLTLAYRDIFLPGNEGLNIEVWRVYNSKILQDRLPNQQNPTVQAYPKSMVGIGWTMHMGMVHNLSSNTPVIEFPDGRRETAFPPKSEYYFGPTIRITRDFLRFDMGTPSSDPKLTFQNGVVWTFGNIAALPLASGGTETVYMVTRIEDPKGNFIDIEYDASDNLRSINKITDSMGREVRFVKSYQGSNPAKLTEIRVRNYDDTRDVTLSYSVGSFSNGFYKLVSFTPPPNTLPPTTYGYNDGFSNNFELTSVATSYGGVLEFVYSNHDFYFNTTKLDSKVVSQKRITFNQGENAQTWNYVYPTYQGVSSGTATVDGPEFDTSATHYAYQSAQADRWKIGLQTSLALSDGSYSASRTWTYHEISTTPWSVLNLPMGTPKGALILSMTESPTGDSTLRSEYDYLRGGGTSVKRYGLPTKISYFVNGSPSAKSYKELAYYFETHGSFQLYYMMSYVEILRDKSGTGTLLREATHSYFDETGKWGALKQTKRWKSGTTNPIYYIWDFTYSRDASNVTISVDGPGEAGVTQVKYQYGVEKEVSTPGFLKYTRTISKYSYVIDERNQYRQTRSYIYDDLGRPTALELRHWGQGQPEHDPFLTISYTWRPNGENRVNIVRGGNTTVQYWDGMGRGTGYVELGDDTTLHYLKTLDAEGRVRFADSGSTSSTPEYAYLYDAAGRITRITDPLGEYTTIVYSGYTRTITDPENHSSVYNYADFPGLPTTLTDAQSHAATYVYDPVGRLTTASYLGRTQSYSYDGLDHIASETHPETNLIEYTYDLANRLYKKSWGGVDNIYNYNSSGQVLSVIGAETVTYEYDDKGAVSSITGASGWSRSGITYNDFGAVTHETVLIPGLGSKSLSYEYDAEGNLTKTVYPDGKEAIQAFNGLGRPETLRFNSADIITSASYGPNKIPASISAGNGTTMSSTFYANGAPNVVSLMRGSTPLYNATYDYDGAGNITGISSSAPAPALNTAFAYDSLNRLTSATYSTGDQGKPLAYSYDYDAYGNMLTVRHDGGIVFNKTYTAQNRINDIAYQYDARGNLTAANGRAFLWDAQNRLKAVTDASGQFMAEYAYDDRGLRIATLSPKPDIDIVNYPTGSGADFTCDLQSECYITFTIFNRGYNYLNLSTPSLTGQDMAMFSVTQQPASSVYPGQSTQMIIKFDPTSAGDKTALLSISSNDPDENPYLINLHGYCVPDITVSGVQGGTYDFGTVTIGESSRHVFTARNVGTATLLLYGTPTIEQSGGGLDFYYEQEGGAWPSLISANGSALFAVRFAPTAEGQLMATLSIASSDPDENPYTITLIGTGQYGPDKVIDESELTLLSPSGGETLAAGSFQDIRWSGGEKVKCVKLEYSIDNGSTFRTIADRVANIGNFPWKVPEELSSSCLIRVSDADGAPVVPMIISFSFNFKVSATAEKVPEGSTYFSFRAGVPDLRTQTYQVAEVVFSPDGFRGTENLLFNDALAEIPTSASFLGRWHQARVTYDMTRFTGSVWIDNFLVLGDVPLRQDLGVQAQPEISISRAVSVPIMLWVDDMEVGFRDISFLGKDLIEVEPRRLFRDNFNRYETALFPRKGGWIDRGDEARQAEKRKAESAVENEISSKAAETGERAVDAIIDDQVYASSSKSFRLEKSSEEPVAAAKRFSIPERIPYCVSGEPFAIIAAGEKGQSERPITSTRDSEKEPKRQKRWDDRETGRADRSSARQESTNVKRAAVKARSSDGGTQKTAKMMSVPATGIFYIYAFDGRLLAEYNITGQLVREYIYFSGQLVAEFRNLESSLLYYASDQINSTRIVTDQTGTVVYSAAHEPYGGIQKTWVSGYDPSLKFSGKQRDTESDLDYFGGRYYDRSLYRFLNSDPDFRGYSTAINNQRLNSYAFCLGNPICYLDSNGASPEKFTIYISRTWSASGQCYGTLSVNGNKLGETIENEKYMIPVGTYPAVWDREAQRFVLYYKDGVFPNANGIPERYVPMLAAGTNGWDASGFHNCIMYCEVTVDGKASNAFWVMFQLELLYESYLNDLKSEFKNLSEQQDGILNSAQIDCVIRSFGVMDSISCIYELYEWLSSPCQVVVTDNRKH